jgi:UTP--glucose-1-phosphate uridylyltransferase
MNQSHNGGYLTEFEIKMRREGLEPLVIDTFAHYYRQVLAGDTGLIYDREILPVAPDEIPAAETLDAYADSGRRAAGRAVRVVLNGGLGTSMGLQGPKSLLRVKNGANFLEIILRQVRRTGVRLALMNSFSTEEATLRALERIGARPVPDMFLQHKFPKVLQDNYAPAKWPSSPKLEWSPPGHGDIYTALKTSDMLRRLLDEGVRYAFICNVDNLGARMSPALLGYFAENGFPFMMEVAEKTPADIKGGHLARHVNGRLILREAAQCPSDEIGAFQDIKRFRYFNTNNIWVNLEYLQTLLNERGMIQLPMILNPKTLDPRNADSPKVFQIETAMGAAVSMFQGATAVCVQRHRFAPVKTCNDLLAVRSDCFVRTSEENIEISPARPAELNNHPVKVKLDPAFFGKIDLLEERFPDGPPSLVNCESLSVEGDVRFGGNVKIEGRVVISNPGSAQAVIAAGSRIDRDTTLTPR